MNESQIKEILNVIYEVNSELGAGFLEKVYEQALLIALKQQGFSVESQIPIKVHFRGYVIGDYYADILVENCFLIELKACADLRPEHSAQVINYLKAGDVTDAFLVNMGRKPAQIKRLHS